MNNLLVPGGKLWFRVSALMLGFGLLVWLANEDQNVVMVLFFSGAICTWLAIRIVFIPPINGKQVLLRHVLAGVEAGLILTPLAILLMAVKTGIHGHGTPDFSIEQMQLVISRAFVFTLSGLLLGLGSGIWRLVRSGNN